MNLFLTTRALTEQREDHLTEFLAAALAHVPAFRRAYADLVILPFARLRGWGDVEIATVRTQVEFPDTGCRPDLTLHLSNGKTILCEHKLLAPETLGNEEDPRLQLERYLELPADGLAYVRSTWRAPGESVRSHARYIRPADREHFLWQDFFPLLGPGQHVLVDWLREGFEELGFTPPHPSIGTLALRGEEHELADALNFAKLWGRTKSIAGGLGCRVGSGSRVQLYLYPPRSLASEVFVSPSMPERFLFRVTPVTGHVDTVLEAMKRVAQQLPPRPRVSVERLRRAAGLVDVVDVVTTRNAVLPHATVSTEELEALLAGYIEPLLRAIPQSGA